MSTSDSREESPSSSPTAMNHAPKFGTLIPNRVFVGGIAANTTKDELQAVFSKYGSVLATKIISDRAGISKGYGFVTFSSEAEAKKIQDEADEIYLNDRKLNIAPAIKKQPFNRSCDTNPVQPGPFYCQNGFPYTYQNGMAVFSHSADPNYSQCSHQGGGGGGATTVQMVYPQQYFVPHQYTQTTNVAPQQVVQSPQWTNWSAPPSYCYGHPNAVIPSYVSVVNPPINGQNSIGNGAMQNITSKVDQVNPNQNLNQIINTRSTPAHFTSNSQDMANIAAMRMENYDQETFNNGSYPKNGVNISQVNECRRDNEQTVNSLQQIASPNRDENTPFLHFPQGSPNYTPSSRRKLPKFKNESRDIKFPKNFVPKYINGVSILTLPKNGKGKIADPKILPLTPPDTPGLTTSSYLNYDYNSRFRHMSL